MTIGEVIKEYRKKNDLSQRQLAERCHVSNGYISMLEHESNSKTNEPIMPTIATLKAIAEGMNMTLNELITLADDMPIDLSAELEIKRPISTDEKSKRIAEFSKLFGQLTIEQQKLVISQIKGILSNQ